MDCIQIILRLSGCVLNTIFDEIFFFNFKVTWKNEQKESCYNLKHGLCHKFTRVKMDLKMDMHLNPSMTGALLSWTIHLGYFSCKLESRMTYWGVLH